jgi:imidazolonepropionase
MSKSSFRSIIHASELITGVGVRKKDGRGIVEADLGTIPDGAMVYQEKSKRIEWVGPTQDLPKRFLKIPAQNLLGKRAVIPGMVDCHTHLIFAGDRSEEFALRCGGATYEEIAKKGGGILTTVRATRAASVAQLEKLAIARLKEMSS